MQARKAATYTGEWKPAVPVSATRMRADPGSVPFGNFDFQPSPACMDADLDVPVTEFEFLHLGITGISAVIVSELAKRGLRPATVDEFVEYISSFPLLPAEVTAVALGSVTDAEGIHAVPAVHQSGGVRHFRLIPYDRLWHNEFRFLTVPLHPKRRRLRARTTRPSLLR